MERIWKYGILVLTRIGLYQSTVFKVVLQCVGQHKILAVEVIVWLHR